jgi:hypothetical protein
MSVSSNPLEMSPVPVNETNPSPVTSTDSSSAGGVALVLLACGCEGGMVELVQHAPRPTTPTRTETLRIRR